MRVFTLHRGNTLHIGAVELKAEVVDRGKVRIYMREPNGHVRTHASRDEEPLETVIQRWSDERQAP